MKLKDVDETIYHRVSDLRFIQDELSKLLFEFHKICEANNLVYNLYGGTLLGAVRHQGFIPWDDDIDVSMPRDDYDKFIRIVKELDSETFGIYCYPKENYPYPYAKFILKKSLLIEKIRSKYNKISLFIDIFPIDGCLKNEKERCKTFKKLRIIQLMRSISISLPSYCKHCWWKPIKILCRFSLSLGTRVFGYKYFLDKEDKLAKKVPFNEAEEVCCVAASWFEKGVVKKSEYLNRKLYNFGKYQFYGMRNYDEHLTNLYGDYMIPPPEKSRISNHNYNLYFEKKYLEDSNE